MRRLLLIVPALLLLPVLLLGAALLWVNTGPGRDMLARQVAGLVPGLTIEGLEGPLPGRLRLGRVAMADAEGTWLEGEELLLELALADLASGTLRIEALTAGRIQLHRPPLSDPNAPEPPRDPDAGLLPSLPSLPVAVQLDRLAVERLELGEALLGQSAAFGVEGSARLDGAGLQAQLAATRQDRQGQLSLDLALAPGADRLAARLSLSEPPGGLVATLAGQPELPLDATLVLDGPASGARLDLRAALGPELGAELAGTVRAAPDGAAGAVLEGRIRPGPLLPEKLAPLAGPIDLSLDADLTAQRLLTLRPLRVRAPAGELAAEGSIDLAREALALKLDLSVTESGRFATLLPPDLAGWQGLRLAGTIGGTLSAPTADLQAAAEGFSSSQPALAAALGEAPRLALRGALPDRLEALTLEGAQLEARASGRVGDPLDLGFELALGQLSGLAPGLEGGLRLEGRATGPRADPSLDVTARAERLEAAGQVLEALNLTAHIRTPASAPAADIQGEARFGGLPLSLRLRGNPEGDWLRLEQAEAALGPARLEAQGRVNPGALLFDGQAKLEAEDLAPLGRLAGQPLAGRLRLVAKAAPREDGIQGFDIRLDAPAISANGQAGAGTLRAQGTVKDLEVVLAGRASGIEAEARARLQAQEAGGWRADIASLRASQGQDTIRLAAPAQVTLRPDGGVETPGLNLSLPRGGSLRAGGRWGPERADLRLTLAGLPAALASQFSAAPPLEGTITGEATVTGRVAAPELRATLRAAGLRPAEAWARGLPAAEIRADLRGTLGAAAEARVEANAGPGTRLVATVSLPRGPAGTEAPLQAALDGTVDVGRLAGPLLAAGADRATGRLNLALRADGTLGAPRLGGTANLAGGEYRNLAQGIRLLGIEGRLRAEGTRLVLERLDARTIGEGRIAARGTADPLAPGFPIDLVVTARGAQPIVNDLLRATLDADLTLTGQMETGARLAGPIRIRRAEITVPERLPGSVRSLDQVTERGRRPGSPAGATRAAARPGQRGTGAGAAPPRANAQAPGAAPPIALALQIQAPRGIFVRGRGVDAELGGELGVGGTVSAPEVSGEFAMRRGTLEILARRLDFTRGVLRWDGNLLPQLDFVASSRAGSVTVQVAVEGPPTEPKITFSSTPELPQDEVLARLLFDRPTRDLSPLEIAQLAQAVAGATGVAGGGGSGILDRVRRTLGLDRLAVGSSSDAARREAGSSSANGTAGGESGRSAPTLEAGRYVADGVYVGVQQGTEAGSARVGVRVDISPRLKLEAQTGNREAGERLGVSWEYEW